MATISSEILADSPLIYYKLDEASGNPVNYGTSSVTADLQPATTQNQNQDGFTCVLFGVSGIVRYTSGQTVLQDIPHCTVEAMVKDSGATSQEKTIFSTGNDLIASPKWAIDVTHHPGTKVVKVQWSEGTPTYISYSTSAIASYSTTKWNHIVAVIDGLTSVVEVFLNGSSVGVSSALSPAFPTAGTTRAKGYHGLKLNGNNDSTGAYMCNLAVYGTKLSAARIGEHASAAFPAPANKIVRNAQQWPRPVGHLRL